MNNKPINLSVMGLEKRFYEPITTEKILDGAVTTPKITDSAITNDKLAEDSVDTSQLKNNSVTTEKIADSVVTNPKIADAAVGSSKIANRAVTYLKLADNAVITEKIKDGSITRSKLGSDFASLGIKKISEAELDTAYLSGFYAVASDDGFDMLIVSQKTDSALMIDEVCQIYIKAPSGKIMRRSAFIMSGNPEWSDFETIGDIGKAGAAKFSEIFNDYESNKALTQYSSASGYKTIAGKKAFKITAMPSRTSFTLDSVEGLSVNDVVSYSIPQSGSGTSSVAWKETQDIAKITAISAKTITLDTAIPNNLAAADIANYQSSTNRIACRLWVNAKPEIGTYDLSTKANARGRENKALGEASDVGGKGNTVTAPYGAAINSGNKVDAESGFAFGNDNTLEQSAIRSAVGGVNNTSKAYATFLGGNQSEAEETARESIGWGMGLKLTNPNEAVVGKYNEPKAGLLFSAGNGTGEDNRHNAFEVYDDGSVSAPGDIKRVAYATVENTSGWIKFAEYSFATYKQGGALLNFKQTYVGSKYNALVELEINTVNNDFHANEGIVFRQLAGKDITDKIGYVVDTTTHNITFYINKGQYEYIYVNLLSDTFGGYMKYYKNEPIQSSTPSFTAKLSNSVLGATKTYVDTKFGSIDLSDYYTKSQVDSKLSSVYKFKGTAIVPLELGYKTVEQGDVYNCQVGGNFCPYIKQSALDLVSMNLDSVNKEITLNFATSMSDILASPDVVIDTVYIAENIARTNGFVYGDVVDYGDNYITVNYSQYVTALQVPYDGIDPVDMFHYYTNQTLEAGDKVTIECFIGVLKSTYYNTGDEKVSVNNGGNVAWTGTTWDNLGGYIDISAKADKSTTLTGYGITDAYTKTQVDGKIAAAIETALNTEV